jgi:glycosyltransferase involved in cell wall biosynthesis
MKIAAVCCTFLRPRQLGELIHCFLRQDYPAQQRELVILDDAGQYASQQGNRWRLVSLSRRYRTLGEKRTAAAALVSDDVEALAVWDDDVLYLPWALRASAAALRHSPWSRPSLVLHRQPNGSLSQHETGGMFHGGWAYTREVFDQIGGYPARNNGEDQALARRMLRAGVRPADPIGLGYEPFYVFRRGNSDGWHLSSMGRDGYRQLGILRATNTGLVIAEPPDLDLDNPPILPGIRPRVF